MLVVSLSRRPSNFSNLKPVRGSRSGFRVLHVRAGHQFFEIQNVDLLFL
jgi:hypothetical protein